MYTTADHGRPTAVSVPLDSRRDDQNGASSSYSSEGSWTEVSRSNEERSAWSSRTAVGGHSKSTWSRPLPARRTAVGGRRWVGCLVQGVVLRSGVIVGFGWAVRRGAKKTAVGWIDGGRPSADRGLSVARVSGRRSEQSVLLHLIGAFQMTASSSEREKTAVGRPPSAVVQNGAPSSYSIEDSSTPELLSSDERNACSFANKVSLSS